MKLQEWKPMSKPAGNTSSSGSYKKRFEKLIKYHIDHASSELESITKKDIKNYSFHLGEHYNTGHDEFDRDIVVAYDSNSDTFFIHIFVDSKEVESILRTGYEYCVKALEAYMFLPDGGTPEYDDLLVEWVVMKTSNTSSQPTSSVSTKTNKEKFEELTDYMIKNPVNVVGNKVINAEVVKLDNDGFTYKEIHQLPADKYELTLVLNYNKNNPSNLPWQFSIYKNGRYLNSYDADPGDGWEELLESLGDYYNVPTSETKEYKDLCESTSSIADDFKLYENLWD